MEQYEQALWALRRAHHSLLGMIQVELDHKDIRDINNVQALMLFHMGKEELLVGDLTRRGHYIGTNVSYNVKKLTENGYIIQRRSLIDKRSVHVKASDAGLTVSTVLRNAFERQSQTLQDTEQPPDLAPTIKCLHDLAHFWDRIMHAGMHF